MKIDYSTYIRIVGFLKRIFVSLWPKQARIASILTFFVCFLSFQTLSAQSFKRVVGVAQDSISGERLGFVNVYVPSLKKGVVSDENGVFRITLPAKGAELQLSYVGYAPKTISSGFLTDDTLRVRMSTLAKDLAEVVVKPKKEKYSKKNNPAVELMHRIRNAAGKHDPLSEPHYSYDKYEKILLALNDVEPSTFDNKYKKRFAFLSDFIDTAMWTGRPILDLSLKEKSSVVINRNDPKARKEIIRGISSNGIDKSFNQENIRKMLEDILREVDIFSNDIPLMQNRFVSPLSVIGPDYYKYYINDTVMVGGDRCVELAFIPRTPESFGFNGRMFVVAGDSTMFVKRVSMRVPSSINLNYVKNIFINQNFMKDSLGNRHKVNDDMNLELQLIPGTQEFYASRQSRYRNFSYDKSESYADFYEKMGDEIALDESAARPAEFWQRERMVPFSKAEKQMGHFMNRFRKVPFLYWSEKVLSVLVNGYIYTGSKSKFDFGPMNTLISYNKAEGVRLRVGGITTANLSKRLFARGYVAYGFHDRKWKYSAEAEYSFNDKKYHSYEFPMNGIRLTYKYDTDQLGQHYLFTNPDNIFLSLKRKESDLITYRRLASAEYNLELMNNFSLRAGFANERQEATRFVGFYLPGGISVPHYSTSSFSLTLRYAPGEKFSQQISNRLPINMDAPVFMLTHEIGPKGLFGGNFTINKTELSVSKRFWFSAFGYTDILLKAGKIWSQVQFPSLLWQNANLSYTIQPESYSLLNPMEFAMDQYASIDFTYWINGAILNRIPLIKKLKLREVITFKGFVGSLSNKNNPDYNDNLFRFPADANTKPMGKTPYMELSAGLDNIFTILRVDYVWRLTYRDNPAADKSGVRISLHFQF